MLASDKAVLLITHYERLLEYVRPAFVHVLLDGRIVRSGGAELARALEREGYGAMAACLLSAPTAPSFFSAFLRLCAQKEIGSRGDAQAQEGKGPDEPSFPDRKSVDKGKRV